jgi:hypothetical protein
MTYRVPRIKSTSAAFDPQNDPATPSGEDDEGPELVFCSQD